MNRRGFTLIELLVYMAIVGIVVVVAGQAFTNSTKMRVRTQSMMVASEVAESVANLLRDDLAQTGAKSAVKTAGGNEFELKPQVYMNVGSSVTSPDSSSYAYFRGQFGAGHDSIAVRRVRYNDNGTFSGVEQVSWYLTGDGILHRACNLVDASGALGDDCSDGGLVDMAENVEKFVVTPATPGVTTATELLFPINSDSEDKSFRLISYADDANILRANVNPSAGGDEISVSGFASNYKEDGTTESSPKMNVLYVTDITTTTNSRDDCKAIKVKKDSVYEISFSMMDTGDDARMFRPGVDHMAVGIRKNSGDGSRAFDDVNDFIFYPPQNSFGGTKRVVRFSSNKADVAGTDACVAFTFAFFSPTVSGGSIVLKDLQVKRYSQDFNFKPTETPPSTSEKKNVRAFQVELNVKKNGESGAFTIVVPIPSNGTNG